MSAITAQAHDAGSSHAELVADFRAAMDIAGMPTKDNIQADGELHRIHVDGDRSHSKNGWYVLNPDRELPSGAFGSWKLDLKATWCRKVTTELAPAERVVLRAQRRRQAKQRAQANVERQNEARKRAQGLWKRAGEADPVHPYLTKKAVLPSGLQQDGDTLVVPVVDLDGMLHGLQFIGTDGTKRFLVGTAKQGHFFLIGEPNSALVVAEGFATGASIHQATGIPVAVAFDKGNLRVVAEAWRRRQPDLRIIIAGDHDADGGGQKAAQAAANATGGIAVIPATPGDWNDVAIASGDDAVRAAFALVEEQDLGTTNDDETATLARLAALSPLDYDRARESEAKRLGVRIGTLDSAVNGLRGEVERVDGGGASALEDPEPWPDPVAGAELLEALANAARRYLILPAGAPDAVALWILHAHAHDTAAISPIMAITSPTPECGKTTLLTLLSALVPRPLPASNITAAALFRAVERWCPTLLIDEADTFLRKSDDLRGVLNSGHGRATAFVIRTTGDDHEPKPFATWAPKAIALIGNLPATLASRSIHIELRRISDGEHIEPLRGDRLGHLDPLRRQSWRWAKDNDAKLRSADTMMPKGLRGRVADNWRHLLAIGDAAGGEWPVRARRAADVLSAGGSEQTAGIALLADLQSLFAERGADRMPSVEIVEALGQMEDRPWPEWKAGKAITAPQLAKLLAPIKIAPNPIRLPNRPAKGYRLDQFREAFRRYLPKPSVTPLQAKEPAASGDFTSVTSSAAVTDRTTAKTAQTLGCNAVTGETGEWWEGEL